MGAIEEVYEDVDADVSLEEFREAVEAKIEQMGGLADEETAAMLIAHDLKEGEVEGIADIEPGMEEVKFLGKVTSVGELRTFERDGEDTEDGQVLNIELADETGRVRGTLWDERAEAAVNEMELGQVLRVKGRPKDGYNGLEVNIDEAEIDDEASIDVQVGADDVGSLSLGQSDVNLAGVVLDVDTVRTFSRDDGSEGRVGNFTLGDESGRVRVTLWDDQTERLETLAEGDTVEIVDGYVRERDGNLELHVGEHGAIEDSDADVTYVPEAVPIGNVDIGETVDIAGVIRSADPTRTFDRDDGSEGQVRNIRVQDDSGDIRVALWGEKADKDLGPGDEVLCADVEIQEGWQEDVEASANWRSTVTLLESNAAAAMEGKDSAGSDNSGAADSQGTGLDAFADGTSPDAESSGDAAAPDDGEVVEFTGTVVQTGDPAMLDDGDEAVTVETTEELQLGAEVTVRGRKEGDHIEADEVF